MDTCLDFELSGVKYELLKGMTSALSGRGVNKWFTYVDFRYMYMYMLYALYDYFGHWHHTPPCVVSVTEKVI